MESRRILTIQDISCVGKCSMTVALPVLSACCHRVSILPTAVLSTHTGGFGTPAVRNLADWMPMAGRHWASQGIAFDGILVGYLGSVEAAENAWEIVQQTLAPGGKLIVDPAMADHGRLYAGLDDAYPGAIRALAENADVLLPNLTEGAMLAGLPWGEDWDAQVILDRIPGKTVVLTGVSPQPGQSGAAVRTGEGISCFSHGRVDARFHGTGDLFAACFTGAWMGGAAIAQAAQLAEEFTYRCIVDTSAHPELGRELRFEPSLAWLMERLHQVSF